MSSPCIIRVLACALFIQLLFTRSVGAVLEERPFEPSHIDRLIRRLGCDGYAERERARRGLSEIGEPALTALLAAEARHPDIEVRRRSSELVAEIERRHDESEQGRKEAQRFARTFLEFAELLRESAVVEADPAELSVWALHGLYHEQKLAPP